MKWIQNDRVTLICHLEGCTAHVWHENLLIICYSCAQCGTKSTEQISRGTSSELICVAHRQSLTWLLSLPGDTVSCVFTQPMLSLSAFSLNSPLSAFNLPTEKRCHFQKHGPLNRTEQNAKRTTYRVICCDPCSIVRKHLSNSCSLSTVSSRLQEFGRTMCTH